jgi:hypothetical protein
VMRGVATPQQSARKGRMPLTLVGDNLRTQRGPRWGVGDEHRVSIW